MSYNKLVNGISVPMTDQEIADRQAEEASYQRVKLADVLPAYRYQRENEGIVINGVTLQTDLGSRTNLLGAAQLNVPIKWKTPKGFVELTHEQVQSLALAVGIHVQKCFDAEATVEADLANYTTEKEIKDAFDAAYSA